MKYICPYCGGNLKEDHIISGTCCHCGKVINLQTIKKSESLPEEKNIQKKKEIRYRCPECSVFMSRESFLSGRCPRCNAVFHFDQLFEKERKSDREGENKRYRCPYCNKKFTIEIRGDYGIIHAKSTRCPHCSRDVELDENTETEI
ncbi:MAG TPA: hypothetical protein PKN36_04490 [bacterium]|nr:hypothetical protein [bacterium]